MITFVARSSPVQSEVTQQSVLIQSPSLTKAIIISSIFMVITILMAMSDGRNNNTFVEILLLVGSPSKLLYFGSMGLVQMLFKGVTVNTRYIESYMIHNTGGVPKTQSQKYIRS